MKAKDMKPGRCYKICRRGNEVEMPTAAIFRVNQVGVSKHDVETLCVHTRECIRVGEAFMLAGYKELNLGKDGYLFLSPDDEVTATNYQRVRSLFKTLQNTHIKLAKAIIES